MKGSVKFNESDPSGIDGFAEYCSLCGWALALAHAEPDPRGYGGRSDGADDDAAAGADEDAAFAAAVAAGAAFAVTDAPASGGLPVASVLLPAPAAPVPFVFRVSLLSVSAPESGSGGSSSDGGAAAAVAAVAA